MARLPRVVIPDYPHHVTQRGNRRQRTFFSDDDYKWYVKTVARETKEAGVDIWAYCLMPNHVHLVAVPKSTDSLARLFRSGHRQYTRRINFREGWQGHLWQERFHSCVMDENHLATAAPYIELNPVRASLCDHPEQWEWSSANAHLRGRDDLLVSSAPMLERFPDWREYLAGPSDCDQENLIRRHSRTGRPAGDKIFVRKLEVLTGRDLWPSKPGRKGNK
jgi:putative transposase